MKRILAMTVAAAVAPMAGQAASATTNPSTSATITYHRATVENVGVFYREAGPKDAPIVVLLHGFPSTSRMYDPLIPLLADRYHVIAPDYPGFGQSDAPSPERYRYSFDHLAQSIDGLLDQLGAKSYTLFMQDYGGPVGFRIAMRHPDRVQALIVQNANAYAEGLGAKWTKIAAYWADPAKHPEVLDSFISLEGARQRHLGDSPHPERYDPENWVAEAAMLSLPGQHEIQGALLYDYRTNVASYPQWQAWLRAHRPPTLVMWGRYDPSFIVPGAQGYARDLPDAEIHILDAGHFALEEATDTIAALTRDFLNRHVH